MTRPKTNAIAILLRGIVSGIVSTLLYGVARDLNIPTSAFFLVTFAGPGLLFGSVVLGPAIRPRTPTRWTAITLMCGVIFAIVAFGALRLSRDATDNEPPIVVLAVMSTIGALMTAAAWRLTSLVTSTPAAFAVSLSAALVGGLLFAYPIVEIGRGIRLGTALAFVIWQAGVGYGLVCFARVGRAD